VKSNGWPYREKTYPAFSITWDACEVSPLLSPPRALYSAEGETLFHPLSLLRCCDARQLGDVRLPLFLLFSFRYEALFFAQRGRETVVRSCIISIVARNSVQIMQDFPPSPVFPTGRCKFFRFFFFFRTLGFVGTDIARIPSPFLEEDSSKATFFPKVLPSPGAKNGWTPPLFLSTKSRFVFVSFSF